MLWPLRDELCLKLRRRRVRCERVLTGLRVFSTISREARREDLRQRFQASRGSTMHARRRIGCAVHSLQLEGRLWTFRHVLEKVWRMHAACSKNIIMYNNIDW